MPYLVCGLGQAGSKIVDEMAANKAFTRLATPFAINSTAKDLSLLRNIPRSHWVGISGDKGLVPGTIEGFEGHVVGGFGKNPIEGHRVMEANYNRVVSFFTEYAWAHALETDAPAQPPQATTSDDWTVVGENEGDLEWKEERESIPFALLILGLGGGTGSGIAGKVAQAIRESSSVNTTILVVGVLPATYDEAHGKIGAGRQAWNALYSLQQMEPHVDGFILVDNEAIAHAGNVETHFNEYNRLVATALVELFSAHLLEEIDLRRLQGAALPMIDIQDVRSAVSLAGSPGKSRPGYASLGWGAVMTRRPVGFVVGRRKHHFDMDDLIALTLRKQTVPGLQPEAASKALGLLRLPVQMVRRPRHFPDTAKIEASLARCSQLDEVHFGITVTKRSTATLLTLLTFEKHNVPRLRRLKELADEYEKRSKPA